MEQNIFQVIKEIDIDDILSKYIQNLVVIMLSSKTCGPCKLIKPKFIQLSKQHNDIFFVYIDRSNYDVQQNKYFKEYIYTPTFLFYLGGNKIAFVEGAHEPSLVKTLLVLKNKIDEKRLEMNLREKILEDQKINEINNFKLSFPQEHIQNNINTKEKILDDLQINEINSFKLPHEQIQHNMNDNSDLLAKKIDILNRLRELVQSGAKLTRNYNLNSDYSDLLQELQFQTNPTFEPETNLLQKKQEQVKQIKELDLLHQKMQYQSLQKIQQLKKIQMIKEQQENSKKD